MDAHLEAGLRERVAQPSTRALPPPSISPTEVIPMWVKTRVAGPAHRGAAHARAGGDAPLPSTSISVSTLPMPFWSVIANPCGASAAAAVTAARRVLFESVQIIARSASSPWGNPTTALAGIRSSPFTPSRRTPLALIAATFSSQVSTKVTSCPTCASSPPKTDPMAPAPTTHTLMFATSGCED